MNPQRTHPQTWLLVAALACGIIIALASPALAQEATPQPTTTDGGTPTPTSAPTLMPTATPTLTELQSRLTLAQTYLRGKDYDQAAALFAAIAEDDRGNAEALVGLQAALEGRAMLMATIIAPPPTAEPAKSAPPPPAPSLAETVNTRLRDYLGTTLAALILVVLIYLLANAIRWALQTLREVCYVRLLPLLNRPAIAPGYLIGEFANSLGDRGVNAARLVPLALTEKLLAWNQLVQAREMPVEPEPSLNLGGMGWLKILWRWILPAPRGYKVTGALLMNDAGLYQLAVQRIGLARNRVERSMTFEKAGASPDGVFRSLASEAAKWLVNPSDIEAGQAIARGMKAIRSAGEAVQLTPSEVFDQALELLLPVRHQVSAGAIDFADARDRLRAAEGLLSQLPEGSSLRRDVQGVIADLRRSVPAS